MKVPNRPGPSWPVVLLCGLVVIAEGYDLIVYGALLPSLLAEPGWRLTSADAGFIGSFVYVGMLIGALLGGRLSDIFGRRRFVIVSVAWFTVWTAVCAFAEQPWQLGAARMVAGIGMGAVLPAAIALAKEYSPPHRTPLTVAILMGGVPVGGILASLLGLAVLPTHGWRTMFAIGAGISVVVLVVAVLALPESRDFTAMRASGASQARLREIFEHPMRLTTVLFALAAFVNLLSWYGLNTWLTTLMRQLDFPLSSALQFSLALNLGAVLGSFVIVAIARRLGTRPTAALCGLLTAAGIFGCVLGPTSLPVLLALLALCGAGAHTGLNLISASVADTYPVRTRATAIGWELGIGRLGAVVAPSLGGLILNAGFGPATIFATFGVAALGTAAVMTALALIGRRSPATANAAPEVTTEVAA